MNETAKDFDPLPIPSTPQQPASTLNEAALREIALSWHGMGYSTLPVVFQPKKSGVGTDKIPLIRYEHWKNGQPQTVDDVQAMPWDRAQGVAIMLWPTSDRIVIDEDGEGAERLLIEAGITLPQTGMMHTPSSGRHHHLLVPPDTPPPNPNAADRNKRAIRLLHATDPEGKPCKPAIDLLFNGIVVVAGPGYREDPDYPLDSAHLAVIPQAILDLARSKNKAPKGDTVSRDGSSPNEYAAVLRGVPLGVQHDTSTKLIGHLLLRLPPNEVWAIMEDWCDRCDPPADKRKVRAAFEDILEREQRKKEGPQEAQADHLTDMGNAQRFATQHGPNVRYCHPWGKWLVWKDAHWGEDDTGEVLRLAKETVKQMYADAQNIHDDKEREAHVTYALRCESEGRLKAMLALAQSEPDIPVLPEDLDKDPWLLNVPNGTLDLRTGALRPHRREDWITKLIPIPYDPQAECPVFLAFLDHIFADNQRVISFLQKAIGYSLTGDIREQVLFLLHGSGANGKTTLLETLLGLLSGYARKTRSETLLTKRSDGIPNDIARLRGTRFVATVEAEEGRRFAESLLKELTGGDTVSARFMRAEWFEFRPEFKLFMAFNHKPTIRGTDHAIWRRIRLIPFTVTIPEEERDKEMPTKLQAEWPGILRWAVEGCIAWQREGLKPPPEVLEATAQYREEMDALAGFLDECCEIGESYQVEKGRLYDRYTEWCRDNDESPIKKKVLGSRLKERGVTDGRTKGVRFWVGVTMTNGDAVSR